MLSFVAVPYRLIDTKTKAINYQRTIKNYHYLAVCVCQLVKLENKEGLGLHGSVAVYVKQWNRFRFSLCTLYRLVYDSLLSLKIKMGSAIIGEEPLSSQGRC